MLIVPQASERPTAGRASTDTAVAGPGSRYTNRTGWLTGLTFPRRMTSTKAKSDSTAKTKTAHYPLPPNFNHSPPHHLYNSRYPNIFLRRVAEPTVVVRLFPFAVVLSGVKRRPDVFRGTRDRFTGAVNEHGTNPVVPGKPYDSIVVCFTRRRRYAATTLIYFVNTLFIIINYQYPLYSSN